MRRKYKIISSSWRRCDERTDQQRGLFEGIILMITQQIWITGNSIANCRWWIVHSQCSWSTDQDVILQWRANKAWPQDGIPNPPPIANWPSEYYTFQNLFSMGIKRVKPYR
jgi:hypothetical protein